MPDAASFPSEPVLVAEGLRKTYGDLAAVDGVSLEVRPGEIVGLVGPNGAGKTTVISMILGVLQPTAGSIHIGGVDLAKARSRALALANFAAVYAPLPGNLSVEQNLRVFGLMYGVKQLSARIDDLIAEFDLTRHRKVKAGVLSSGEQTRVALAKAMLNRPRLLLLDEPTASIDPSTARDIRARILEFAHERQAGVLWTSHNMYEVAEVCDRVLFLSRGRVLLAGEPERLVAEHAAPNLEELFIRVAHEHPATGEGLG
ncbi:ABC transporter ATP-binding protein [Phenylobacterium sp. LjRoot219]|uniref:ABC transporter ATP-binding protein n=1 Tax=Phenylobacterium sp. LjRoot219 TaxID=3342283 RepID=UPI003ED1039B